MNLDTLSVSTCSVMWRACFVHARCWCGHGSTSRGRQRLVPSVPALALLHPLHDFNLVVCSLLFESEHCLSLLCYILESVTILRVQCVLRFEFFSPDLVKPSLSSLILISDISDGRYYCFGSSQGFIQEKLATKVLGRQIW